ncbi:MAG: phosphate acetyltransferase [Bacteroidetes bacterium 24-39-8]|nr:MAG: phosphate acetyltransferase [Bacteroidetes bacterium 24-39-8]OZA64748.1 MAG: phosphate acetyltransferase [Sphingobacteriia bacterium 39-39-8]HQR91926.1 phosphate acetyltransferase [Sediminibacterium sp.]HQS55179.1 phosphate acetyltransferase [Sediminibacterium sp.]
MTNAIYLTTTEPFSGKSIIALGLMNLLSGKTEKIAYFKPIISINGQEKDNHLETISKQFGLDTPYEDMFAFTREQVVDLRNEGNEAFMIDTIIDKFKNLQENNEFVIVEGADFMGRSTNLEFDDNITIAKNLGIPVFLIVKGEDKTVQETVSAAISTYKLFQDEGVQILTVVVNKLRPELTEEVIEKLQEGLPQDVIINVIPQDKNLGNPTIKEIVESVNGKALFGEHLFSNQVDHSIVGAMQLHNCLLRLKKNTLIVTPGDRGDILSGVLQANISKNYPKIAGIILTGGLVPEPSILKLIEGLDTVVPIIQVETGTFETVNKVASTESRIAHHNKEKIALAISTFDKHIDIKSIGEKINTFHTRNITPRMFQYQIVKRAKEQRKHIVLPEGGDDRILLAADMLVKQDVVEITILGIQEQVAAAAQRLNIVLDFDRIHIVDPATSPNFEDYANTLYELRKAKKLTLDMARDLMLDVSYFGTMMVYKGDADGMVSGALHTTQHTIRPALQFVKTKPGVNTVSSVFFMCLPNRVSIFGDCAVNPNPSSEQLAEIAISSAETSIMFGIEPKIALLSYSSGTSGEGEDVDKVRRATEIVREKRPDLKVEGPIQYDAAVDPSVGKKKMPNSEVAGQASVLIFPDLNTGNNTYKAVQRETGALAIGPMLQGLNKPVNDLSRGCTVDDVFNTVVITAIQAQQTN